LEEPLPAGGSCLLASINLSEFVKKPFTKESTFDYENFKEVVKEGVIYLNEMLDEGLPLHPLKEQQNTVRDLRQIGLGIMGIADMFIKLGIKYGSEESLNVCDIIGFVMADTAIMQSSLLAKDYGIFPKYKKECILNSPYFIENTTQQTKALVEKYGLRNSQLLTIAPTGSISTMLGVSGGLEPIFMISYTRKTETLHDGDTYYKVYTPIAKDYMTLNQIKTEEELPEFFITSMTLDYKDRINIQSVWQRHIDASISSTVNVPKEFTIEETEKLYMYAWEQKLKGITIYRDGCARTGILTTNKPVNEKKTVEQLQEELQEAIVEALKNNPNKCPMCGGEMFHSGGCKECRDCGYSPCSI